METLEFVDGFDPHTTIPEDDEFLRSLLSDVSTDSTPDSSPPHMFEDSTPEVSPSHWSQELNPPVVPQLSELSLELNPDLLYGTNFTTDFGNFMNLPITDAPTTPPKEILLASIQIPSSLPVAITAPITTTPQILVPIVQPLIQALPIVQPPHVQVPIVVEPPKKARVSGKKRARAEVPNVPSPEENVSLNRDTLLNITSQSMERYVETLQTTRHLTNDDQKELKRQKRLIKNRESAQLSRERKRAYIDQLEAKIAQLMADNGQLKNDNTSLREALAHYQSADGVKVESSHDLIAHGKVPTPHQIKMGNLLTVGSRSTTATAGVCLLIVLFSFGLFMNVNKPNAVVSRFPAIQNSMDMNLYDRRAITPVDVGFSRGLLEAYPEVKDEDMDMEPYAKALPYVKDTPSQTITTTKDTNNRHVIRFATSSSSASPSNTAKYQQSLEMNKAGVFSVSYTPKPASFVDHEGQHSHDSKNNKTFTLILDPRPDLSDDENIENSSSSVSASHENQIQVSTPGIAKKNEGQFPPMIISLVIPEDIANGSNPLLLPEGLNPSNSMMEITCQVVDISITTTERPSD